MSAVIGHQAEAIKVKARRRLQAVDAPSATPPAVRSYDAAELLSMPMADPNYIVRPFVPEGVTLWCGRPKAGKTTALRQLAHAANNGGAFLGENCANAEVWFLSLEEGERLFRQKLNMMNLPADELRGIRIEFEWPQGADGVKALRDRLEVRVDVRPLLIIIDSLQRFRLPQSDRGHAFTEDYNAAKLLGELCKAFPGLAIVILHHTTKAMPDDPVAAISGTYGLTAAADSFAIMLKQGTQFRLHAGGRLWDRDNADFELKRSGGSWQLVGDWDSSFAAKGLAPKQEAVLDALKSGAKSNRVLADMTGQSASALSHMMAKLEEKGLVIRIANGWGLS
jgi:RecA-family ATPase/biotin operon repressor